ncbi:MAG: chemotaxis protein MotB [Thermoleophilia bacterium]|nr:chemotaxis protein MotB [Thermoleophilia bacterium]
MSDRRNKRGGGGGEGGEERWLLPYADMITLLLGLFIVLFAMSSVDAKKFDHVRQSLAQTFKGSVLEESGGVLPGSTGVLDPEAANRSPDNTKIALREQASDATQETYKKEQAEFEQLVKEAKLDKDIQVVPNERGFTISLAGDAFFDTGQARIRPQAEAKLRDVAAELVAFNRKVVIIGHTDASPFGDRMGNQRLSSDRANSVFEYLWNAGMQPADMEASGVGATRPKQPYTKNGTRNVAANRRIEILVLAPGSNDAGLPSVEDISTATERGKAQEVAAAAAKRATAVDLKSQVDREVSTAIAGNVLDQVVEASGDTK